VDLIARPRVAVSYRFILRYKRAVPGNGLPRTRHRAGTHPSPNLRGSRVADPRSRVLRQPANHDQQQASLNSPVHACWQFYIDAQPAIRRNPLLMLEVAAELQQL
jgi:hypothetical protein